jgi:regulator of replication initiation timing
MNTQLTALHLAEALEAPLSAEWMKEITLDHIAAELRRLHTENTELQTEVQRLKEIIDELENDDPPKIEWVVLCLDEVNRAADREEQSCGFIQGALWAEAALMEKNK